MERVHQAEAVIAKALGVDPLDDQVRHVVCGLLREGLLTTEPAAETFAVVTVYVRPDGRRVVHVWGPRATRREATNLAARMRREDRREYGEDPRREALSLHVCQLMDEVGSGP